MKRKSLFSASGEPVVFLVVALCLTTAAVMWLGWSSYGTFSSARLERQRDVKMEEISGTILHLNEVLTMSARMVAATGKPRWETRYRQFQPELAAAIREATQMAPEADRGRSIAATDAANIKLVEMDTRAFDLIAQGRGDQAKALLFSGEYDRQKRIFANGLAAFDRSRHRYLQLARLRATIVHLDEILTMSARMAAATGDLKWERRYLQFEPKLTAAIEDAIRLKPGTQTGRSAQATDAANIKLVEMESRAFDMVRQGKADEARTVLFSDEYGKQKRIYANGMARFGADLTEAIHVDLEQRQRQASLHVAGSAVIIVLVILAWVLVLRAMRKWRTALTDNNNLAMGREQRVTELKREVNELARKGGIDPPYDLALAEPETNETERLQTVR